MVVDGAAPDASGLERAVCNPFYVLGLTPAARASDLAIRFASLRDRCNDAAALTFATPAGPRTLCIDMLQWAFDELRDRDRRLLHEMRYVPPKAAHGALRVVGGGPR